MEGVHQRKSLRMKYANRSIGAVSIGSQEDLCSAFEIISNNETAHDTPVLQSEDQQCKPVVTFYRPESKTVIPDDSKKLVQQLEKLKSKLELENLKNIENEKKITLLQKTFNEQKVTIKDQESRLADLDKSLSEKSKVIQELATKAPPANKSSPETEELQQLKEILGSCSFDECLNTVHRMKEELQMLSIALQEERDQVAAKTKEISILNKALADEQKIERDLENFLSVETAKNKKLEEELKYVIRNVNEEKTDLKQNFEKFKAATHVFLENCQKHRAALVQAAEDTKRAS